MNISKFDLFSSERRHEANLMVLAGVGYFFLMFGNGIVSLTHPDEVFYVQTAKEMLQRNDWLTPYIFGAPQFEKPIFFYWLLEAGIKFFGLSPFAARFWPAIFGIGGMLITYWLAWMMSQERRVAFWSALVLGTSFIYVALSRAVLTDMVFSVLVVTTIAFFYAGYQGFIKRGTALIWFFIFMGISVLTKGLLGIAFPLTCALAFSFYKRDFKFFKSRALWIGMVLFVAIISPWHVLMYQKYGMNFVAEYWQNVHVNRLLAAEHPKNDTWYFYIALMVIGIMPWTFLLPAALRNLWITSQQHKKEKESVVFIMLWILSIFIFLEPAHSKLASYIFPAFPAIAIIVGYYIARCLGQPSSVKWSRWALLLLAVILLLVVVVGNIFIRVKYRSFVPDMTPVTIFSVVMTFVAGALIILFLRKDLSGMIRWVPGVTVAVLVLLLLGRSDAEPWVSCHEVSARLKAIDQSQSVVLSSKFYVRGILYYTDRSMAVMDINGKGFFSPHPIPFLNSENKLLAFLRSQPVTYGVLKEGDVEGVERITRQYGLSFLNLGGEGGKYIVRIERDNKNLQPTAQ